MIENSVLKQNLELSDPIELLQSDANGNRYHTTINELGKLVLSKNYYQYYNRAKALNKSNNSSVNIAIIGDSNTDKNEVFHKPLISRLSELGTYQAGFVNFHVAHYPATNVLRSMTGGWTLRDRTTGGSGLNLSDIESNNSSDYVQFETVTNDIKFDTVRIIFLRQSGGGDFEYKIDSGTNVLVNTSGTGVDFIDVPVSYAAHYVSIYVKGTGNVRLLGAIIKSSVKEFSVHKLAQPGCDSADFASDAVGLFETQLSYLNLDLCIVNIGTNDIIYNTNTATYKSNLIAIVDRIRSVSNCSILLISPSDTGYNPTENESEYDRVCKEVAILKSCNFLSLYELHGAYSTALTNGIFIDQVHYNYTFAGEMNADFIYNAIK